MSQAAKLLDGLRALEREQKVVDELVRIACDPDVTTRVACAAIARGALERLGVALPSRASVLAAIARSHAEREKSRRGPDDDEEEDDACLN